MLNNIQLSKYINTSSCIHKLSPICKLVTLIIFLFITMLVSNIYLHCLILIYLFILILISKINIREYLKTFKSIFYLLLAIFIINAIFQVNIISNIINISKIIEMIFYSSLITMTTSDIELINGFNMIFKPLKIFKININEISFILSMSIKFVPIIIDQINDIIKNLRSKGINLKTSKHKILIIKSIIIPTLNLSIRKADLLADNLTLKLYNLNNNNINYNKWKLKDSIILIVYILCLILVIWRFL